MTSAARWTPPAALALCAFVAAGCGSIAKERGHDTVSKIVRERTGYRTRWESGTPGEKEISGWVDQLLAGGLTRDRAVEIALVNNPSLQIVYEELGVSQADMVQAGLVSNPTIAGSVGFPLEGGGLEYEASVTQSFLDVFLLPMRKRVAKEQFIAETLRVAHETLHVATEVRKALARYQAETRMVELRRGHVEAARVARELAERLHDAGNIDDFTLTQEAATAEQAQIDLAREELRLTETREELNRMLGLFGPRAAWKLAETLPDLPPTDPRGAHLENVAVKSRLDVAVARKQTYLFYNALDLAKSARYFGLVQVGVHAHQDPEGAVLLGPTLSLELPIFDQRQGLIGRLEAQYRQTRDRWAKAALDARVEVREATARLEAARKSVERYKKTLLPLRDQAVQEAQLLYNGMQIGLFQLLAAKQAQVDAYRSYLEAVGDYWAARADLEMAVGGRLTRPAHREGTEG